jgi:hypothetical protein
MNTDYSKLKRPRYPMPAYIRDSLEEKGLSSNSPLLAARDEFEFVCIRIHRRVSGADVIPCSLLQGEFIGGL